MSDVRVRLVASLGYDECTEKIDLPRSLWDFMDEDERSDYLSDALQAHVNNVVQSHYEVEEDYDDENDE